MVNIFGHNGDIVPHEAPKITKSQRAYFDITYLKQELLYYKWVVVEQRYPPNMIDWIYHKLLNSRGCHRTQILSKLCPILSR